ncbi:MAG: pentapeptide repeat-containing protein [Candidatus Saccharibacteria bacterium]
MKDNVYDNEEFTNIDYSGQRIANNEFIDCIFVGCDFSDSILTETDFINCRFESCNFAMAKPGGTGMKEVFFKDCKLIGISFDYCADFLFAVSFDNCVLDYSSFAKKKMKKTHFLQCSLQEVDFSGTDLSMAVFDNSNLSRAVFSGTNLEKADFRTAYNYNIDLDANKVTKAKFSYAGIAGLLTKYKIELE